MNRKIFALSLLLGCGLSAGAQDYFWTPSGDRYKAAESIRLDGADSVVFRNNRLQVYRDGSPENWMYSRVLGMTTSADSSAAFYIGEPERALWKPTTSDNNYNNNYSNPESRWSFKNSRESKHFIVFWDKQFGDNPLSTGVPSNLRVDVTDLLKKAEQFFETNVDKLKMATVGEGQSQLDTYKMSIYLLYQTEWLATGSGYDDVIGALWVNPSTCKPVGHTIAHEIGHSFQYQVACDWRKNGERNYKNRGWRYGFGANGSGGNGFWEQCAQWQGFQDYPSETFGYHVDVWKANYHRHVHHEWMRYASYWWQYHLVEKHGYDAYGRLWRESRYPEDPMEAYTRLFCGGDWEVFWDDYFEYATKLANYQFEDIHKYLNTNYSARNYKTAMYLGDDNYYQVAYRSCPETTGVNFIQVNSFKAGEQVSVDFKGLDPGSPLHTNDPGHAFLEDGGGKYDVQTTYNAAGKAEDRGWHYAFVAIVNDGTTNANTVVSEVQKNDEGTITFTVPTGTIRLSLCVVGTPKTYNRHAWDEKDANDVQWPYKVKFTGCKPTGIN